MEKQGKRHSDIGVQPENVQRNDRNTRLYGRVHSHSKHYNPGIINVKHFFFEQIPASEIVNS